MPIAFLEESVKIDLLDIIIKGNYMHEVGIAQEVLNAVFNELKEHDYSKVELIELAVGEFNMLSEESLQNAFDLVAVNTKAKGAELKVNQIPGMEIEIKHIEAK